MREFGKANNGLSEVISVLWDRRGGVAASEGLARGLQRLRESRGQGGLIKFIVAFIQIWLGMCECPLGEEQLEHNGQCVLERRGGAAASTGLARGCKV